MLSSGSSSGTSLEFKATETVFIQSPLHPSAQTENGPPSGADMQAMLPGVLTLRLPKPKLINEISVRFVIRYDIPAIPGFPFASGILYENTLKLNEESKTMTGTNVFQFVMLLPSNLAPYQRTRYGRVYGRLEATAKFQGKLTRDLSTFMNVHVIHNPAPPGQLPPDLGFEAQQYTDQLGPHIVQAEAAALTASSLVHFRVSFVDPPHPFTLEYISAFVKQSFILTNMQTQATAVPEPQLIKVFQLDGSNKNEASITRGEDCSRALRSTVVARQPFTIGPNPPALAEVKAHEETSFKIFLRLPNDDLIRASTAEFAHTPIRISHQLIVSVRYTSADGARKEITVSKDVFIASCCCVLASIQLPSYNQALCQKKAVESGLLVNSAKGRHCDCICGASLESIMTEAHESGLDNVFDDPQESRVASKVDE